jgi:hypothetical protein
MDAQESLREIDNLRLRFQMNNRLRLECLAALSKIFREHGENLKDELLSSLVFAIPAELPGERPTYQGLANAAKEYGGPPPKPQPGPPPGPPAAPPPRPGHPPPGAPPPGFPPPGPGAPPPGMPPPGPGQPPPGQPPPGGPPPSRPRSKKEPKAARSQGKGDQGQKTKAG